MAAMKKVLLLVMATAAFYSPIFGGKSAEAQVHHVVGDDRGWDLSSDVVSWAAGRVFRVGDFLWFTYSAAMESIVELSSKEEFESCTVSNPTRMYTDGLDKITLDGEGIRYFASGNPESCAKGLKLPVDVLPKSTAEIKGLPSAKNALLAAAPVTPPSDSTRISGPTVMLFCGALFLYFASL